MSNEKLNSPVSGYVMLTLVIVLFVLGLGGLIALRNPAMAWMLVISVLLMPGFFFLNPNTSVVLVLFGDYKGTVKEQPGSASVVQGVSEDRNGAGYSGIGYTTSGVRAVPLAAKQGDQYYAANYENVISGKYPMSRFLLVYINRAPGQAIDPLVSEFAKFIFSKEGQEIVIKDGYFPLPASVVSEELKKLQ